MATVLNGIYFITNNGAYLTSNGNGAAATLECANNTSFQIWTVTFTPLGYLIQNYGTGGYLVPNGKGGVTAQLPVYTWGLPINSQLPNTYSIQDSKNTTFVLGTDGLKVDYEAASSSDITQCWTFTFTTY